MTRQALKKIQGKLEGYFPFKPFLTFFAALILAFVVYLFIQNAMFATGEHKPLTGKIMASISLEEKKEVSEPPPPPPLPQEIIETAPDEISETPLEPPEAKKDEILETPPEPSAEVEQPSVEQPVQPSEITIEDSVAGLSETTKYGPLPIIRPSDNLKPLDAYKAPFKLNPNTKAVISIILVDYGLSDKNSELSLTDLPPFISFVASPFADNLQSKISTARQKLHEVWLNIPIEDVQKNNEPRTGLAPDTLLMGLKLQENMDRLNTNLGRATGYAGVAFTTAPSFDENSTDLQNIINSIGGRGLGITQMNPEDIKIKNAASRNNSIFAQGDIWIDNSPNKQDIQDALAKAEKIALTRGQAIAVFRPSPIIFSMISEWEKSLDAKNIQLTPLSYTALLNKFKSPNVPQADVLKE